MAETVLEKRRDERSDHAGYGDDGDEENELDIVEAELGGENRGKHHDHRHAGAVEQRCAEEHGEIAEFGGLADRGFELEEGVGEEPVRGRAGGGGTFPESEERGNRQRKKPEAGEDEDRAPLVGRFQFESDHEAGGDDQQEQGGGVGAGPGERGDPAEVFARGKLGHEGGEEVFAEGKHEVRGDVEGNGQGDLAGLDQSERAGEGGAGETGDQQTGFFPSAGVGKGAGKGRNDDDEHHARGVGERPDQVISRRIADHDLLKENREQQRIDDERERLIRDIEGNPGP